MSDACFECGSTENLHMHHVVPRSRGGTKTIPLCERHHAAVHGHNGIGTSALTRAALAVKASRRELVGAPRIGERVAADGVRVERDPAEAEAVALIVALRRRGMTIRGIAAELNAHGVPARGGRWHPTTVARVLRRGAES